MRCPWWVRSPHASAKKNNEDRKTPASRHAGSRRLFIAFQRFPSLFPVLIHSPEGTSAAEAALDLANLIAHTQLSFIRGTLDAATAVSRLHLFDEVAGCLPVSDHRLATHLASARLRLGCVHAFRPASTPWLPAWIEYALSASPSTSLPPCGEES